MEKFKLRSWCIGFEVPFYDQTNRDGIIELQQTINDSLPVFIDPISSEIKIMEATSGNAIIIYLLVIRVDEEYKTLDWENNLIEMQEKIKTGLEDYLTKVGLEYSYISTYDK